MRGRDGCGQERARRFGCRSAAGCGAALLLVLAAACGNPAPKTTVQQYMENEINPAGDFLFHSVQDISDARGVRLKAPETAAQWKEVQDRIQVLQDSPKVLTAKGLKAAPPGFKSEHPPIEEEPTWIQHAIDANRADFDRRAMRLKTAADAAATSAQNHDARGLQKALDGVDKACESCHLHYFYPGDKRAWQAAKEDGIVE